MHNIGELLQQEIEGSENASRKLAGNNGIPQRKPSVQERAYNYLGTQGTVKVVSVNPWKNRSLKLGCYINRYLCESLCTSPIDGVGARGEIK